MKRLRAVRAIVQVGFAALIVVAAIRHQKDGQASVDALCPFGAVETLITWITTGQFISKIHASNLVMGLAVLAATVLVGNAFCGWVCPFGTVQDALAWVRRKLRLPTIQIPEAWDRRLRWGRFAVLAVVIYFSATTAKLWFAGFDPYLTLFSLHWWFEFNWSSMWLSLVILGAVLAGSLVVERLWCRYLCPLGAVFAVLGRFSLLRIRRSGQACTDCTLCDRPCPVGIKPSQANPLVNTDCIGCMDCVAACPVDRALRIEGPVLLGMPIRPEAVVSVKRPRSHAVAGVADTGSHADVKEES